MHEDEGLVHMDISIEPKIKHLKSQYQKQNSKLIKICTVSNQPDKMKTIGGWHQQTQVSMETMCKDRMINCVKC